MKGLEHEFERFRYTCLAGQTEEQVSAARGIFLAGAGAATNRFLSIVNSDLEPLRKKALIRRIANEMEAFKRSLKPSANKRKEVHE